jgi:uncharacterized protein YndB with AHSA1/START domain
MATHSGYLVIADISGYTVYLTSSELEHATPILRSLLGTIVGELGDPLNFLRMEGDAVLAYSDRKDLPSGETFLGICENIYNAFSTRRLNIIQNTTCNCRACANVKDLDLKIIAHHGAFETIQIGPVTDISGADVILVHRMAKTDVKEVTGIASYAMFSEAAVAAMDVDAALTPYSQTFEHFGEVGMQVYDLAAAWERFRDAQERHFLEEEDGVCTYRRFLPYPKRVVWEALVAPEMKRVWMGMRDVTVDRPEGRIGPGSGYHCAHEAMDFYYWVSDWRPFDYFSTNSAHPAREDVSFQETYAVTEAEGGTEVRWTMTACRDKAGAVHEEATKEVVDMLSAFWPPVFDTLEEMLKA